MKSYASTVGEVKEDKEVRLARQLSGSKHARARLYHSLLFNQISLVSRTYAHSPDAAGTVYHNRSSVQLSCWTVRWVKILIS